jgi:uncharacterized protein (DUF433 family)
MPEKPAGPRSKKNAVARSRRRPKAVAAALPPRRSPPRASKRETELLGRINAGLSEPRARRLDWLDSRRAEEALTPEEHAELLALVDESGRLTVSRAEALVELARLRVSTVPALMDELGLGTPARPLSEEHIVQTPDTCGGKPRVRGTRVRVKDVVLWHERMGMSPEEIVSEWPHLKLGDVYSALAYYDDNRAAIDAEMRAEEQFASELEAEASFTARGPKSGDAAVDPPAPR